MSASTPTAPSAPSPSGGISSPTSAQGETAPLATPAVGGRGDAPVYAIVEASGQQFWLQPNRYLDVDRMDAEVGSLLTIDTVLLVSGSKGATLGQPYVLGATVQLKVMAHRRGPKILVYKMRRKKKTRRKAGHRQELTRVMVEAIQLAGKPIS